MDLNKINKKCETYKKPKLSCQAYNLFTKIQEVLKHKKLYDFYESHPECIFKRWNSDIHLPSKKTNEGIKERKKIINIKLNTYKVDNYESVVNKFMNQYKSGYKYDDILDSIALSLLSFERLFTNKKHFFLRNLFTDLLSKKNISIYNLAK